MTADELLMMPSRNLRHELVNGELRSSAPASFGAPDLAVEVILPSDTLEEVEEKVDEYSAAGAQMVFVANPKRRTITVHRPGSNPVVLREEEILDASPFFRT